MNRSRWVAVGVAALMLTGCSQTVPPEALQFTPETLAQRQLQTRRFDTLEEKNLLSSSAAVLQDLGFTIERGATDLGLIAATKETSAVEPGQVAGAVLLFLASAAVGAPVIMPVDKNQKVRVSLTTRPSELSEKTTLVRITFQRIVWNTSNRVTKTEMLTDGKLYQDFFEKLSKAVFLDAHEL